MTVGNYKNLKVWQAGMRLSVDMYIELCTPAEVGAIWSYFTDAQGCGQRTTNIAEGYQRQHDTELRQFLHISLGSLAELETYLHLCRQLGYLQSDSIDTLFVEITDTAKMLRGLIGKTYTPAR